MQAISQINETGPRTGQVVGSSLTLGPRIDQDNLSDVYEATRAPDRETFALRVFESQRGDEAFAQRLAGVANKATMLAHEHIATVHGWGQTEDGSYYLVGEWIEGNSLELLLQQSSRPLPWVRATRLALQICRGLHAAHRHGLIHRNLTARNCIIVDTDGPRDLVKIVNFGLTGTSHDNKLVLANSSSSHMTSGTDNSDPHYRAPELCQGHPPDSRSDVYALGVVMYQMLTGRLPFLGSHEVEIVAGHLTKQPPPFSDVAPAAGIPAPLEALVLRALHKDPQLRFQTTRALTEALIASERALLSATQLAGNSPQELRAAEDSLTKGSIFSSDSAGSTSRRSYRRLTTRRHMLPGARLPTPHPATDPYPEVTSTLQFLPDEDSGPEESANSHLLRLLLLVGLLLLTVVAVFLLGET